MRGNNSPTQSNRHNGDAAQQAGWLRLFHRCSPRRAFVLAALTLIALIVAVPAVATVAAAGMHSDQATAASRPAHALPIREEPAENAILKAPPSQVCIWFSEPLNPGTSHIVVVDPTNHEVDRGDSHVSNSDATQMCVTMPLVPAGTYVVAWRSQSAIDGHVTGGSYIFRIARPDGTIPAIPTKLPTGHFPGAGGVTSGSGTTLDGPSTLQAIGTWLAYVFLAFWLGGLIWETWILPPTGHRDPDLDVAARRASGRFFRLAPYALVGVLLADVCMVFGETAELAGSFGGMADPSLLHAVLFGSQFGTFWWGRQVVALASLGLLALAERRGLRRWHKTETETQAEASHSHHALAIPDWRREIVHVWRGVPGIPRRLAMGARARATFGRAELLLGLALLVAFALSGHAAAVPTSELGYALVVDLIHLIATATWVGGLFYISFVLVPALGELDTRQRARVLALGLPEFGAIAIVSAVVLAVTGILNTTIHLNGPGDFFTTVYGRILAVKIELFLIMVAISAYHAFFLRPRLAHALAPKTGGADRARANGHSGVSPVPSGEPSASVSAALSLAATRGNVSPARGNGGRGTGATRDGMAGTARPPRTPTSHTENTLSLARRIESWLRREAALGIGVLLCVSLLAAFAGTLATTPTAASATQQSGPYTATQTAGNYAATIAITPDTFGTNTFTVTLKDAAKNPVTGASVIIETSDLDMDMGTQTVQLQPVSGSPGAYSGSSELTMAGHWQVVVKVLPPNSKTFVSTTFKFFAGQGS